MSDTKLYDKLKVTRKDSEAEIEAEIPTEVIAEHVASVIRDAKKDLEMPGFRKGQIPEEIVKKQLNEMHVLEDAADLALREAYPQIVEDEKLQVVTAPRVTITKLAPGNPLGFKARVGIMPEFKMPDYKKIGKAVAEKQEAVAVTDAELDDTIRNIQMMRVKPEEMKKDEKGIVLPELTDEYVKSVGQFDSVQDFKDKLSVGIKEEKETAARRKLREDIAEKLSEAAAITLPQLLVDEEVSLLRNRRFEEVEKMGVSMEDYLKQLGKTEAELDVEEKTYVERQLKTRFILERIAEEEKVQADPRIVEENAAYLMERNPNIDPDRVRGYVEAMLVNEQVLELLEGKKKAEPVKPPIEPKEKTESPEKAE